MAGAGDRIRTCGPRRGRMYSPPALAAHPPRHARAVFGCRRCRSPCLSMCRPTFRSLPRSAAPRTHHPLGPPAAAPVPQAGGARPGGSWRLRPGHPWCPFGPGLASARMPGWTAGAPAGWRSWEPRLLESPRPLRPPRGVTRTEVRCARGPDVVLGLHQAKDGAGAFHVPGPLSRPTADVLPA